MLFQDLNKVIRENLGVKIKNNIEVLFKMINDMEIIEINVEPSNEPIYHKGVDFFIRDGPASIKLTGKDLGDYIFTHFKNILKKVKELHLKEDITNEPQDIPENFINWVEEKSDKIIEKQIVDGNQNIIDDCIFIYISPYTVSPGLVDFFNNSVDSKIEGYYRGLAPLKYSQTYCNPEFLHHYNTGSELKVFPTGEIFLCLKYGRIDLRNLKLNIDGLFETEGTYWILKKFNEKYGIPLEEQIPGNLDHFLKILCFNSSRRRLYLFHKISR